MKKWINLLLGCLLAVSLAMPAFAEENAIRVSDAEAKPGDTVYLTVSLNKTMQASSMGIKYTFDEKVLKVLPGSCSWEKSGIIKDFSGKDNNGVWAAGEATEIEGDVCVLAFEVLKNAKLTSTLVECTLVVEHNGKQQFKASGVVRQFCDHEYGAWNDMSTQLHSRSCKLCGKEESQSHAWDDGREERRDGTVLQVFFCTQCGARDELPISAFPEAPEVTQPTVPDRPEPTVKPTVPQNEHQHAPEEETTGMIGRPVEPEKGTVATLPGLEDEQLPAIPDTDHDHDHDHEQELPAAPQENAWITAVTVLAVLAALVCGAVLYLKKKK